jgi:hypothetical protein
MEMRSNPFTPFLVRLILEEEVFMPKVNDE